MSRTHTFHTSFSLESSVADNTLQLIAGIYQYSAGAASRLLTDLIGEPVEIGLEFAQGAKARDSTGATGDSPDGSIIQRSFKILVEAKIDSRVSPTELLGHAGLFGGETRKILILLTKEPIGHQGSIISALMAENRPEVIFRNITFWGVCEAVQAVFGDDEPALVALAADYREYCDEMDLFGRSDPVIRIVPCGRSLGIIKRFGIYFQLSDRAYTPHGLVGLYADKRAQAILDVESILDVDLDGGQLKKRPQLGEDTEKFDSKIREIIEEARASGHDLSTGYRFLCGEVFETDFKKSSRGELMGTRFVNLREVVCDFTDAADLALKLKGREW
ncbi:MAG: hypothetical protein M1274_11360 [Actinobacteria bacterium]|nr:hypothetical protein [Actinomycetota bacterium]